MKLISRIKTALLCTLSEFTKDVSIGVSVFTLTALSGDRFFAIVDPLRKFHIHSEFLPPQAIPHSHLKPPNYHIILLFAGLKIKNANLGRLFVSSPVPCRWWPESDSHDHSHCRVHLDPGHNLRHTGNHRLTPQGRRASNIYLSRTELNWNSVVLPSDIVFEEKHTARKYDVIKFRLSTPD